MKDFRRVFFEIAWRVSLLALPWQTRWFADAHLVSWPWEQGRMSLYVSWIPMIATVVLGILFWRSLLVVPAQAGIQSVSFRVIFKKYRSIFFAVLCLVGINIFASRGDAAAFRAIAQWWIQVGILAMWAIVVASRRASVSFWFVIAMIPVALLGVWQWIVQRVVGSTLFGMSNQLPATHGVSVIAINDERLLRVYGSFPHPNIFGAWLAVGVIVAIWLAMKAHQRTRRYLFVGCATLFSATLFFTFARSAWIALACGVIALAMVFRRDLFRLGQLLLCPFVVFVALVGMFYPLVISRVDVTGRLETKSIDARVTSLRDGVQLFLTHPLVGTGPNVELLRLAEIRGITTADAPLEPPHDVFLIILADEGLIGILCLVILKILILQRVGMRNVKKILFASVPLLIALLPLALLDHYLWTTWSGEALLMSVVLMMVDETNSCPPPCQGGVRGGWWGE